MHTWDGLDPRQLEYDKLVRMNEYERKAYVRHEDYLMLRADLNLIKQKLRQAEQNEKSLRLLAKERLKRYASDSKEEDWTAFNELTTLADYERNVRVELRASMSDRVEGLRLARVQWEQANQMVKTNEQLNS